MKVIFQLKFLLHLVKQQTSQGFTVINMVGLLIASSLLGITLLGSFQEIAVSESALPRLTNQLSTAKQLEAKNYVNLMKRAQQAYYLERQGFASEITALEIGIKTQTDNYVYGIGYSSTTVVTNKGLSLKPELKSYISGVSVMVNGSINETVSVVCESNNTGAYRTVSDLPNVVVDASGNPSCPSGYTVLVR